MVGSPINVMNGNVWVQQKDATQGASTTESYTYDPVGNRLSSLGVASYTTNSSNELTAKSGGVSYTYDNNGNTQLPHNL